MRSLLCGCLLAASLLTAAYPPQESAASLDALLRDVWAQGVDKAYGLYMGKKPVPMAAAARDSFAQDLLGIAHHANVAAIILQKEKMEGYSQDHLPAPQAFEGAYFVHFMSAQFKGETIQERIYINVHPDHAAEVIGFIVRELLVKSHGFMEAKVATPAELSTRADAIVIYAQSLADVDWGLGRLAEYQTAHKVHFLADLPAATRPRLNGVSTAAQPEASLKADSFGSYLANTAAAAMSQQPPPADFAGFRQRVRALMTADGVDPDHPDRLNRRP